MTKPHHHTARGFTNNDEPLDQPLHELDAARVAKGVTEGRFFILSIGATRRLPRRERVS